MRPCHGGLTHGGLSTSPNQHMGFGEPPWAFNVGLGRSAILAVVSSLGHSSHPASADQLPLAVCCGLWDVAPTVHCEGH